MDLAATPGRSAVQKRRRGTELEEALLDAAWAELLEHGYAGLTIEGVAHRAGTSRPVVYRRWSTKQEVARSAVNQRLRAEDPISPDTGTLRGDVLAVMADIVRRRAELTAIIATRLGTYFEETGSSFADLRSDALAGRGSSLEVVLERASQRGEIAREHLSPRVASLPLDLLRQELLMTLRPVPDEVLEDIVDTVFLPLVLKGRSPDR